jgi:hypothetical protein
MGGGLPGDPSLPLDGAAPASPGVETGVTFDDTLQPISKTRASAGPRDQGGIDI